MELLEILKQFKNIEPEESYKRNSLSLILKSAEKNQPRFRLAEIIFKRLESGAILSLATLSIFVILSGLSAVGLFSPAPIASLDKTSLKAEAEAIDIQINLADLSYKGGDVIPLPKKNAESTKSSAVAANQTLKTPELAKSGEKSTSTVSIDEALQKLSE